MNEKSKTDKLKGPRKLADSAATQKHVDELAKKLRDDPSFPLLHETARKMHEKHSGKKD